MHREVCNVTSAKEASEQVRFPLYLDTVPDELKPGKVWVCCDSEKVPMVPLVKGWRRAKSTDPKTWRSLDEALTALGTGRYAGIGRVIEERDNFVGIDIDGCRNPETGRISQGAWEIIEQLDSYSEISPSGTGIKIWVKSAKLKAAHVKPRLEIYSRGRYFTVTGQFLSQCSTTIKERSSELEALINRVFPRPKKIKKTYTGPTDKALELNEFLDEAEVEILAVVGDSTASVKYRIACPWVGEHTNGDTSGTYVGQYNSGALFFHCNHSHCTGRTWQDFRLIFEPDCYVPWWVKVVAKNA
jgi:hypothetical protein